MYDGNPHTFSEKGFMVKEGGKRVDPRAFRVVGGNFTNSAAGSGVGGDGSGRLLGGLLGGALGGALLAQPPEALSLQPFFAKAIKLYPHLQYAQHNPLKAIPKDWPSSTVYFKEPLQVNNRQNAIPIPS